VLGGQRTLPLYMGGSEAEVDQAVMNAERVYFSIRSRTSSFSLLAACPLSGCPNGTQVQQLEDSPGPVSAMDLDGTVPYYARAEAGSIHSGKAEGSELLFEGELAVGAITHDAENLYWATSLDPAQSPGVEVQNYIAKGPKLGGSKEKIADVDAIAALHQDGDWVYFAERTGRIGRVHKSDGTMEELATDQTDPRALTGDANSLYWTSYDRNAGKVLRMAKP